MSTRSQLKSLFAIPCVTLAFSACQLSDNARKSAENSKQAADNSTQLLDLSQNASGDGRQGGARANRVDALEAMAKSPSLEGKIAAAGAYFSAMEFQLWKGQGFREDTPEKRDRMIQEGLAEFLKIQKDYNRVEIGSVPFSEALKDESFRNVVALSAALHKVSDRQVEAARRYGFTEKSMNDVLSDVMTEKRAIDADASLLAKHPGWMYEALRESADIEYLLKLRMNFFMASGLQRMMKAVSAKTETVGEGEQAKVVIKGVERTGSAVDVKYANDLMGLALNPKMLLAKGGVATQLFPDVEMGAKKLMGLLSQLPPEAMSQNAELARTRTILGALLK